MSKNKLFLAKLKALLKEYNADIQFACAPSSDTYGIYDGGILIRVDNKQVFRNHNWYKKPYPRDSSAIFYCKSCKWYKR